MRKVFVTAPPTIARNAQRFERETASKLRQSCCVEFGPEIPVTRVNQTPLRDQLAAGPWIQLFDRQQPLDLLIILRFLRRARIRNQRRNVVFPAGHEK